MAQSKDSRRSKKIDLSLPSTLHSDVLDALSQCISSGLTTGGDQAAQFKLRWLQNSMLSKFDSKEKGSADNRRQAAIAKWQVADKRNQQTNHRLLCDSILDNEPTFTGGVRLGKILRFARKVVEQVIGDSPPVDILRGAFSNGASTRVKRSPVAISEKYVGKAHVTVRARELFINHVLPHYPLWDKAMSEGSLELEDVPGSVMFTVPKNSEIDRVACKEPEINMFMQKGVGDFIRHRLKRRGIDLNDQSINRGLAREGSLHRKIATLDLSSASDLISTQLVYLLLPLDWFYLLDSIRVERTLIGDTWHELSMFSSMGNGFTFELESLLFYSLSCAINRAYNIRGRVSVFGDDIITPVAIAPAYRAIFSYFGFVINAKKSYWRGKFRESCGGHYFDGHDVTPFYVRRPINSVPELTLFLNNLRLWATQYDLIEHEPMQLSYAVWLRFAHFVPRSLWGGRVSGKASKTSLVSPHNPRKMLIASTRDVSGNQLGAYLHWLHSYGERRETITIRSGSGTPLQRELLFSHVEVILRRETQVLSVGTSEQAYKFARNRTLERRLDPAYCWFCELV